MKGTPNGLWNISWGSALLAPNLQMLAQSNVGCPLILRGAVLAQVCERTYETLNLVITIAV